MEIVFRNELEITPEQRIEMAAAELLRRSELRKDCRNDLLKFIEFTHPNWETAPHHRLLCDWLMRLEDEEDEEVNCVAVFAPPRHGKSEVVSRRFPAWCMGRNPDWQMICAQANGQLAQDMGANVRDIIDSPEYREVFPDIVLKKDAQAAGRWMVSNKRGSDGVYYACGIGGKIIGRGANLLNIDDPLDAEGAYSPRQRDVAAQFYYGDALERLMTPGLQLFTSTRRHEDDLAGRILPHEKAWEPTDDPRVFRVVVQNEAFADTEIWWVINLQAIANEGKPNEEALWPGTKRRRFPLPRLKAIRSRLISQGHAREWFAQYQQVITPEEGNFCKKAWFEERYDCPPEDLWIYATSDVAVTQERVGVDPDFTEHAIFGLQGLQMEYGSGGKVKATADTIYVLDWWYGRVTPDKWLDELIRLIEEWQPQAWFGTKGVIRNAIEPYLEREIRNRRAWVNVEWLSDVKDKAAKGSAMQKMASRGRILFPRNPQGPQKEWPERVIHNVCTFPNARHDDAFDTLANMARSLKEIPDAFIGAPVADTSQYYDRYEEYSKPEFKNWKVA